VVDMSYTVSDAALAALKSAAAGTAPNSAERERRAAT